VTVLEPRPAVAVVRADDPLESECLFGMDRIVELVKDQTAVQLERPPIRSETGPR
jgi:hypothetical protein